MDTKYNLIITIDHLNYLGMIGEIKAYSFGPNIKKSVRLQKISFFSKITSF